MAVKGFRLKLNSAGVRDLLSSAAVQADLGRRAKRIANAAGDGFETDVTTNSDRAVAFVRTATYKAREAEAEGRALTRAINAGR